MSATHRLADALRSLSRFSEADGYYREVLAVFPRNDRSLIDLAKTYVHANSWGRADEFLRNEILNFPELKWNKSVNFYMGWTQIGGLAEKSHVITNFFDSLIEKYSAIINIDRNLQSRQRKFMRAYFFEGMDFLELAFFQYPNYLIRWKQVDWLSCFRDAVNVCSGEETKKTEQDMYSGSICISENMMAIRQSRLWLAWRLKNKVDLLNNKNINSYIVDVAGFKIQYFPNPNFEPINEQLKILFNDYKIVLVEDQTTQRIMRMERKWKCLLISKKALNLWNRTRKIIINDQEEEKTASFHRRWEIDQFAEIALFTIKMLMEGGAYEQAISVAKESYEVIIKGLRLFYNNENFPIVGNKVIRYQLSLILSWLAYGRLIRNEDWASSFRIPEKETGNLQKDLAEIEQIINKAHDYMSHNPLMLFSRALLYKKLSMMNRAIDELHLLESVIAPFDPHKFVIRFVNNSSIFSSEKKFFQSFNLDKTNEDLFLQERINGKGQIDNVINLSILHLSLSKLFEQQNKNDLAAEHTMRAICYSEYKDLSADLLLKLANIFSKSEKFNEASSALDEAISRRKYLSPLINKSIKELMPLTLECVVNTNKGDYSISIEKFYRLKRKNLKNDYDNYYSETIEQIISWHTPGKYEGYSTETKELIDFLNNNLKEILSKSIIFPKNFLDFEEVNKSAEHLQKIFTLRNSIQNQFSKQYNPVFYFISLLIDYLVDELITAIIINCELWNNSAFNMAELSINYDIALSNSNNACKVIEKLKSLEDIRDEFVGNPEINFFSSQIFTLPDYDIRMKYANYYDTKAWVIFKADKKNNIQKAYDILQNKALKIEPNSADIQYHLAKLCVNKIEKTWQGISLIDRQKGAICNHDRKVIEKNLRLSRRFLRNAYSYNQCQTLFQKLRHVQNSISFYQDYWSKLNTPEGNKPHK